MDNEDLRDSLVWLGIMGLVALVVTGVAMAAYFAVARRNLAPLPPVQPTTITDIGTHYFDDSCPGGHQTPEPES